MLSAYSNNPINLLINAPSGVGKNYVINIVASLFPQSDILSLAGMTDKALFHRSGKLVIKNEITGEYESIEESINALD
jgi:HD-like signal output (HDOD) protein